MIPGPLSQRVAVALGVGVLCLAVLAGCGDSGDSKDGASTGGGATTAPAKPSDPTAAYVGLPKAAAIARANAARQPWRIGREDDEQFMLTQDFIANRVTFELDDGRVTKATLG